MAAKKKNEYKAGLLPEEVRNELAAESLDMINNLSEGIALRDEAGVIIYANQAFANMVQINIPTKLVGIPFLEFVHGFFS